MTRHWTFEDSNLANNFGEHVRGQLPWYDLATGLVRCIAENYLPSGGLMYDIGASDGNITRSLKDIIESRAVEAISIEQSEEMIKCWSGNGKIEFSDACTYEYKEFDLCVCFLTLMFISPSDRRILLAQLRSKIKEGGALVVVDKFNGSGGYFDTVLRRMTMRQKLFNGESADDILDKELSLSGVQRPLDLEFFDDADVFFQVGEFRGFIFSF
jgi:tRNA (cmo5U34)-methyltransferase